MKLRAVLTILVISSFFLAAPGYSKEGKVSLNLKEVELPVLIRFVSEVTGKGFVFDERVKGKVTIVSPRDVSVDELYEIFLSILDFKGYTALPDGRVIRIVPSKEAKQKGGKVLTEEALKEREGFITRLIPLQFIKASEASKILAPLISPGGVISFLADTNTLVITDSPFNIDRMATLIRKLDTKPQIGRLEVFVYYLKNARAEDMAKTLGKLFSQVRPQARPRPGGLAPVKGTVTGPVSFTAERNTNALIVRALPQDYEAIKGVIEKLDIKRRQVFVEAAIMEVSLSTLRELGFEFRFLNDFTTDTVKGAGGTNFGGIGAAATGPEGLASLSGLAVGVVKGKFTFRGQEFVNVGALLRALESQSGVNILSTPQLLTMDNQEAEIVVGENVPIITSRTVTTGGNVQASVERQDIGVRLRLTPHITEGEYITLDIYQEISSLAESVAFDPNQVGPLLNKRFANTSVIVKDSETVVIAGLIKDDTKDVLHKVPLLGDIPILGNLFKYTKKQKDKTNLLVFITPRIIREDSILQEIRKEKEKRMEEER